MVERDLDGEALLPSRTGWMDEPREDPFIQLLRFDQTPGDLRAAIIKGCKQLHQKFLAFIDDAPHARAECQEMFDTGLRLCRLIDIAGPKELSAHAKQLLGFMLNSGENNDDLLGAATRAAMAYQKSEEDVPVWEKLLYERKELAAYAFHALLEINPRHARIQRYLKHLWLRQFSDGWDIDVEFLAQSVDETPGKVYVENALREIRRLESDVWQMLKDADDSDLQERVRKVEQGEKAIRIEVDSIKIDASLTPSMQLYEEGEYRIDADSLAEKGFENIIDSVQDDVIAMLDAVAFLKDDLKNDPPGEKVRQRIDQVGQGLQGIYDKTNRLRDSYIIPQLESRSMSHISGG